VARRDPPALFDLIEEPFDQVSGSVKAIIEAQASFEPQYSSWHGRNHHNLDEHPRPRFSSDIFLISGA
jgi:hypothetical protein